YSDGCTQEDGLIDTALSARATGQLDELGPFGQQLKIETRSRILQGRRRSAFRCRSGRNNMRHPNVAKPSMQSGCKAISSRGRLVPVFLFFLLLLLLLVLSH